MNEDYLNHLAEEAIKRINNMTLFEFKAAWNEAGGSVIDLKPGLDGNARLGDTTSDEDD